MEKLPVSEYSERKREEKELNYEQTPFKPKPTYPTALTDEYYEDLRTRVEYKGKDWYLSFPLKKYATAVRNFYSAVMVAFNNTLYQPIELPEYVKNSAGFMAQNLQVNMPTLDTLAENLTIAEKELMDCLSRNNTTMEARCNKHKHIKQLREFSAKAWMLYDNIKQDNFYHAIVDFKTRNADKDMSIDRNIALVSMGHYKTQNYVQTKVKNYFSVNGARTPFAYKHGASIRLYQGLDAEDLFNNILEMFGGYNYKENKETLTNQQAQVTQQDAIYVINFYKNYADVKQVYKSVFSLIEELQKGYNVNYVDMEYLIQTNKKRDVFQQAKIYLEQITNLLTIAENNADYSFVVKDCMHLQNKLNMAILELEPYHLEYEENLKKSLEHFKNTRGGNLSI